MGSSKSFGKKNPEIPCRCFKFFQHLICLQGFVACCFFFRCGLFLFCLFFPHVHQECDHHIGSVTNKRDSSYVVMRLSQNNFPLPSSCNLCKLTER